MMSLILLAGACVAASLGGSATIVADRDATLIEPTTKETATGSGEGIYAGRVGPNGEGTRRRAVLRFSMDGIPAGSTITSVTVTLTSILGQGGEQSTALHRTLADWGEGASASSGGGGAPPEPGDATWSKRFWPEVPWSTSGGEFTPQASAVAGSPALGACVFASSAELVADVQNWVDDPSSNFGWIVIGNEGSLQTVRRFGSRESADKLIRPTLVVEFDPPGIVGDIDGNGVVDGADLALVLGSWGACSGCATDLNDDGIVDGADLAIVLGNWS